MGAQVINHVIHSLAELNNPNRAYIFIPDQKFTTQMLCNEIQLLQSCYFNLAHQNHQIFYLTYTSS